MRAEEAPEDFDARRSARGKRYVYTVLQTKVRSPLRRGRVWEIRRPLDLEAMRTAALAFLGKHDFSDYFITLSGGHYETLAQAKEAGRNRVVSAPP